jgi:hypothetical protein
MNFLTLRDINIEIHDTLAEAQNRSRPPLAPAPALRRGLRSVTP